MPSRVILAQGKHGVLAYFCDQGFFAFAKGAKQEHRIWQIDAKLALKVFRQVHEEWLHVDGNRALLGKKKADQARKQPLTLMLVPTTACHGDCGYCYASGGRHPEPASIPLDGLATFLKDNPVFNSAIVYGGESLMTDGLAAVLRGGLTPNANITMVTGMAFPEPIWQRKAKEAMQSKVSFVLSIDPPPEPSFRYSRSYHLYNAGMAWYYEQLRRAAWLREQHAKWSVRPTVTLHGVDWRSLRNHLKEATGAERIPMNVEPCIGTANDPAGILARLQALFGADVHDVLDGRLDIRDMQHLRDRCRALLDPDINFSPGGCYDYTHRISLGPRGELSFCNEVPTYLQGYRQPWLFGENFKVNHDKREDLMQKLHRTSTCAGCPYRFICGCLCPVKISQGQHGGCEFGRALSETALQLLANIDNPEIYAQSLPKRIENLKNWQAS